MSNFGFIGVGNMGGAIAEAVSCSVSPADIFLTGKGQKRAQKLAEKLGARTADVRIIAAECDYIFLGVKPQYMAEVLEPLKDIFAERTDYFTLVSMAAGLTIAQIQEFAGGSWPVIRIMPNTPVSIGEGIILYDSSAEVTDECLDEFLASVKAAGLLSPLPERLIDAGTALTGCGPAFADLFIEALADGAVACGIPRKDALIYAAAMTAGSAKLVLETGKHPAELKDAVCSPGGSTIQGVRTLEEQGFRGAVMDAVISACEASKRLG